jgi:hypothetical protein
MLLLQSTSMSKTVTPDLTINKDVDYEVAVRQLFDEMAHPNEKMERDQEEIELVKAETREILARLKMS